MALIDDLKAARDNLGTIVRVQTEAWVAAGCPPTFSVDGESYNWNEWLKTKAEEIDALTATIQRQSSPFIVRSRGRA